MRKGTILSMRLGNPAVNLTIMTKKVTSYLSLHTAAPSLEYYVQLRCQCKIKGKIIGDKKVQ